MDAFEVDTLPADLAAELEGRFFWWGPDRSMPDSFEPRTDAAVLVAPR
jgi:hypothetical protein